MLHILSENEFKWPSKCKFWITLAKKIILDQIKLSQKVRGANRILFLITTTISDRYTKKSYSRWQENSLSLVIWLKSWIVQITHLKCGFCYTIYCHGNLLGHEHDAIMSACLKSWNYLFFLFYWLPRDTKPGLLRAKDGAKKLMDLVLEF